MSRAVGIALLAVVVLIVVVGVALWWRSDPGPENGVHHE